MRVGGRVRKTVGRAGAGCGTRLAGAVRAWGLTGPRMPGWADGCAGRRRPSAGRGAVAMGGYGLAALVEGYLLWTLCWFVAATATAAVIPLIDVLNLRLARREGFSFSVPRGCGSAAFVVANLVMGALLVRLPVDAVIVWVVIASGAMALYAAFGLPPEVVSTAGRAKGRHSRLGPGRLGGAPGVQRCPYPPPRGRGARRR